MKEKIYVHVADDHKILIEGIIAVINTDEDIEIRDYSLTGKEVVDWIEKKGNKADVLVLDITMPILDGIEVYGVPVSKILTIMNQRIEVLLDFFILNKPSKN